MRRRLMEFVGGLILGAALLGAAIAGVHALVRLTGAAGVDGPAEPETAKEVLR